MAIYSSNGTKLAESTTDIALPDPGEIQQLKRMADSLQEEVELAKKEAEEARKEAKRAHRSAFFSKIGAILSFLLALAALIESILADIGFMSTLLSKINSGV